MYGREKVLSMGTLYFTASFYVSNHVCPGLGILLVYCYCLSKGVLQNVCLSKGKESEFVLGGGIASMCHQ